MKKIGLTGGIGSGKSVVASIFNCLQIPIYNSDIRAKNLMVTDEIIIAELIKLFGVEVYKNSILQKQVISEAVFSDASLRYKINSIVHPRVRADFNIWSQQQESPYVIMESALLFESDLYSYFDMIIYVTSSIENRIARVKQRDGISAEDVMRIIKIQPEDDFCIKKSDFVVENNNTFVIPQVLQIHESIMVR